MILSHIVHDSHKQNFTREPCLDLALQYTDCYPESWPSSDIREMPSASSRYKQRSRLNSPYQTSLEPPPSPPMENSNNNLKLPSIHNLIGVADASPHRSQQPGQFHVLVAFRVNNCRGIGNAIEN